MKIPPNIRVKRCRDKVKITLTVKQAKAIACLLGSSCTRALANTLVPGAFHDDIYRKNTWDSFAKAGIPSSFDMPGVHHYPDRVAEKNGWKFPVHSCVFASQFLLENIGQDLKMKYIKGNP